MTMPSIQERIVAGGRGVRTERDLAEAASDFYVLELLTARGDPDAARMLSRFEAGLAKEFACYLDMAIGGELRYAMQHLGKESLPPSSPASSARSTRASAGWRGWP